MHDDYSIYKLILEKNEKFTLVRANTNLVFCHVNVQVK